MSFLKNLAKSSGNKNISFVDEGIESSDITGFIDTGSYAFNALVSGSIYKGIPNNKITVLAGETTTGKTFFAISLLKAFLDANEEASCVYFDTESAVTAEMFLSRGVDPKRVVVLCTSVVEEFRTQAAKMIDMYEKLSEKERKPVMFILDSLGMLSSAKEMRDILEGKDTVDMTRAKAIKATFRVLSAKLGSLGIPMILTNHTYQTMEMFSKKTMGGGTGPGYAASTVVFLSKRKEKEDDEVVGNIIHCTLNKSRFTKENSMIDALLRYDSGLNRYHGLLDLAIEAGIFKKVSTRIELPDGSTVFGKTINEDPEKYFTKDVLDEIDKYAGKKFLYGSSYAMQNEVVEDDEELVD